MNSLIEKKKTKFSVNKIKKLKFKADLKKNIEKLSEQKNQLEIEKQNWRKNTKV